MSAHVETHQIDDDHDSSAPHSTLKGYLTGFVLAAILTALSTF